MIRLLIADDERMEREALADIVMRRFEHEVTVEMAENGRRYRRALGSRPDFDGH